MTTPFTVHVNDSDEIIIRDNDELAERIKGWRQAQPGISIVLTMGSFDMFHIGHARYLREAATYGDILVVGVDSDEKVKKRKGENRPIYPEAERLEGVSHTRYVTYVTLKGVADRRWHLVQLIHPDVLIATQGTYTEAEVAELKAWCREVRILEPQATTSTSNKIRDLFVKFTGNIQLKIDEGIKEFVSSVHRSTKTLVEHVEDILGGGKRKNGE